MAFWTDAGGGVEPKRAYRWLLLIPGTGEETSIPAYVIKNVNKPSFEINEAEHAFLNHTFFYPGRILWSPISFTMVDPIDLDAASRFVQLIVNSGYTIPLSANIPPQERLSTISKLESTAQLGALQIKQIDAQGNTVELWELVNPWIKSVSFSDLDYTSDDISTIDVEIRYDRATLTGRDGKSYWGKSTNSEGVF
jgi:hypothetical protein